MSKTGRSPVQAAARRHYGVEGVSRLFRQINQHNIRIVSLPVEHDLLANLVNHASMIDCQQ
jgi:hypothetical protein